MADVPWTGGFADKFYLQSGQLTSTIKTSQSIGGLDTTPRSHEWDGTNTLFMGTTAAPDKIYITSGQFTSTVKDSQPIGTWATVGFGCSDDGVNTPFSELINDRLMLLSGKVTSTLKTSQSITAVDTNPYDICWDGTNTPWTGQSGTSLYITSGQFTSTLKSSYVTPSENTPTGISYTGVDTLWSGDQTKKLYVQSGQITSTVKDSENVSSVDTSVMGISTTDLNGRLGLVPETIVTPDEVTLTLGVLAPTVITNTAVLSEEALTFTLHPPTIEIDTLNLEPFPSQEMNLAIHAPTVVVTDDIKTIVANTRNFAISEYAAFAYNSMCKFNGKYMYAKADGIYEGGGDDDNGAEIVASYKTGSIDIFATEVQKMRNAFCNFRSNGDIQLFSVGDEVYVRSYTIINSTPDTIHERRVKLSRGIRQRHFNFGVSNINGSTLEVDSIKILTEPIRKRR